MTALRTRRTDGAFAGAVQSQSLGAARRSTGIAR
jgi:hypothetical protein